MSKPIGSCELNNFLGQKCIAGQMFVELCNEVQLIGPEEIPILVWGRRKRPPTKMGST